jgi:hypothetical protein
VSAFHLDSSREKLLLDAIEQAHRRLELPKDASTETSAASPISPDTEGCRATHWRCFAVGKDRKSRDLRGSLWAKIEKAAIFAAWFGWEYYLTSYSSTIIALLRSEYNNRSYHIHETE